MTSPRIRLARPAEAAEISSLAIRSKAHWGYTPAQMKRFAEELTLTSDLLALRDAHVLEAEGSIVGFYTLVPHGGASVELEHLFVEPDLLRGGFGAKLLQHARERAAERGFLRMVIQSDPNAEGFYRAHGAELVMNIPTSIPGRTLPLMDLRLWAVDRQQIHRTIRDFLDLIEGEASVADREARLALLLDRLALAQHFAGPSVDRADYPEAPRRNADELRSRVCERFPNYGFYNLPEAVVENIGESSCVVGDAIDDLAEIAADLYEIEWYWSNTGEENALRYLQLSYRTHWQEHLRGLQLYLKALDSAAER